MVLDENVIKKIIERVDSRREEAISLLAEMIKTPSPTGKEKELAELLRDRISEFGYGRVFIDKVGNVIGIVEGEGGGKSILYNGHMDTIPPGEMKDPYSAKILDGSAFGVSGKVMWGRGTSDMKGALAAMIMAGSVLADLDLKLKGDTIVTATVFEEEPGNIGPPALIDIDGLKPDAALIGEASNLDVTYGNRGVVRTKLTVYGRSCHVSVQERGINALYKMCDFIEELRKRNAELPSHPALGKASWAICELKVVPNVVNVVPDRCIAHIDTRNIPGFSYRDVINEQRKIIDKLTATDPEFKADIELIERDYVTWTGYETKAASYMSPFYIEPDHWLVKAGAESAKAVIGREPKIRVWGFTTECCCFTERGIPTIGLGPGEERFTHSVNEVIGLNDYITAIKIYAVLAARICMEPKK